MAVAEDVDLDDPYENLAVQLVKEAASKTNEAAGDGTTTATVLAEAIYKERVCGWWPAVPIRCRCAGVSAKPPTRWSRR